MSFWSKAVCKKWNKLNEKKIKCVFIGDSCVGKTELICSYVYNRPKLDVQTLSNKKYFPSIFAVDSNLDFNKQIKVSIGKQLATLNIWDTFGDHKINREYSYKNAHVIVICYNIGSKVSLNNVYEKWYKEVQLHCPKVPVILVGTQMDRRHNDSSIYTSNTSKFYSLLQILQQSLYDPLPIRKSDNYRNVIEPEVGRIMAKTIGAYLHMETSISTKFGVDLLFRNALKLGLAFRVRKLYKFQSTIETFVQKPFLPPHDEFPNLLIKTGLSASPCAETSTSYSNVIFYIKGCRINCHSIILSMGSLVFENLFRRISSVDKNFLYSEKFEDIVYTNTVYKTKNIPVPKGFEKVWTDNENNICFDMSNIDLECFKKIISFYYTGKVHINSTLEWENLQLTVQQLNLTDDFSMIFLFTMNDDMLFQFTDSKSADDSIWFIQKNSSSFVNNPALSDCQIKIGNSILHGHKYILVLRCSVLAAMFNNIQFKESQTAQVDFQDTTLDSFLAVLEYLYTGNCKQYGDLHGTLQLANFLCLPRLIALCEEEIVKCIKDMKESGNQEVYAAALASYHLAQFHNAPQLSAWCLHFMAINYNAMCRQQSKEMKLLEDEALKYLKEQRWPPVWYLKEQDHYERAMEQLEKERSLKEKKKRRRKYHTCFY